MIVASEPFTIRLPRQLSCVKGALGPCKRDRGPRYVCRAHSSRPCNNLPQHCAAALAISIALQVAGTHPVQARSEATGNKEVDDNSSALIQGLLAKSKANKDQYTKDRLNDYYRRNYKDYFSFEKGLKAEGGASTENQQKIREWLKNNP